MLSHDSTKFAKFCLRISKFGSFRAVVVTVVVEVVVLAVVVVLAHPVAGRKRIKSIPPPSMPALTDPTRPGVPEVVVASICMCTMT